MMKQIFVFILAFFTISAFAVTNKVTPVNNVALPEDCKKADPIDSPTFCTTFEAAAKCYCRNASPIPAACKSASKVYEYMLSVHHGNLEKACKYAADHQPGTTPQECIDDWNCWRSGGRDSNGKLC